MSGGPIDRVRCSDPGRLGANPKLEVLGAVVVLDAVEVVDRFVSQEMASELLLHHEDVFEDVGAIWASPRMVGDPQQDVAGPMRGSSALPRAVVATTVTSTGGARPRLPLLRSPALARVLRATRGADRMSARGTIRAAALGADAHTRACHRP